jgi:two-component system, cell cycle sensor histidine kinase and response regulator CckA
VSTREQDTLRASEQRYGSLFSHMRNGLAYCRIIYDAEHRPVDFEYLGVNDAFKRLTGLHDLEGKRFSELIPGLREQSPELYEAYARVVSSGIGETIDFDFKSQNQWLNICAYSPEPETFVAAFEDITARKQAEAESRLQGAALNAAADAMLITDRDGTIVWVNPAFSELTGYGQQEAIGGNARLLKSDAQPPAFYVAMWQTLLAGEVWRGELINRKKDGVLYPESQTITPVKDAAGVITHFIAIQRDLTHQRLLERQYVQAQRMETVGRLAGGIAHDFNNLLTVINGRSELALTGLPDGAALRSDLQEIHHAGWRAAGLTRQLLAFSRQQVLQPDVLALDSVVAEVKDMLGRLIGEDVALVFTSSPDLGRVKADRGQIEQVIMNLVLNARDAMPRGGTLTIETRDVDIQASPSALHPSLKAGRYVMLAVSDTGTGMDARTRERIFEPFFTTKSPNKGTGLGLSTAYGIVQQSGGSISVDTEVAKGSTFRIYLPRVEDEVSASRRSAAPVPARGTETVLVVEDEGSVRRVAEAILESAGYHVLVAASAEDALPLVQHHDGPVDLVLTDVVMPGMNGRDLAARLVALRPRVRVLYTSGYTDDTIIDHGVLKQDLLFISKPYSTGELTQKVRQALDS